MTTAQRQSTDALIAKFGQAVTLTRRAAGAYDPATGQAAITPTSQAGKGVILPLAPGSTKFAGTTVVLGDKYCILSGLTDGAALAAPTPGDTVTDVNSTVYEITAVAPLAPAGLNIIHELHLRAAA